MPRAAAACLLLGFAFCGPRGHSVSLTGATGDPTVGNEDPPASVAYAIASGQYEKGMPIAPNGPTVVGGTPTSYTISPPLPAGLQIDAATGVISGTPSASVSATVYTVTASNPSGSVITTI